MSDPDEDWPKLGAVALGLWIALVAYLAVMYWLIMVQG